MEDVVRRGVLVLGLVLAGCTAAPVAVPRQLPAVSSQLRAEATAVPTVAAEPTAAVEEPTAAPAAPMAAVSAPAQPQDQVQATPAPASAAQGTGPSQAAAVAADILPDRCTSETPNAPLPAPGSPGSQDFFRSFRDPLPPAALYNPPGQTRRVGLQAGHWLTEEVPPELGRLQQGATGGGKQEWEVNLDVARRTAALLQASGVEVDVLPATVPPHYEANLFLALHSDGDPAGQARGFKIARPGFSSLPDMDDRLVSVLNNDYEAVTGLPRDDEHISLRMRYYYAFNARRYCHAVSTGVPQAIIEMGYLTSPTDRQWLLGTPDKLARGIANGVTDFLATLP